MIDIVIGLLSGVLGGGVVAYFTLKRLPEEIPLIVEITKIIEVPKLITVPADPVEVGEAVLAAPIELPTSIPTHRTGPATMETPHKYLVIEGDEWRYDGDNLLLAKQKRKDYPDSVLIADGVNRG